MDTYSQKWKIPLSGLWGFSHCAFFDSWYPWSGETYEARLQRLVDDMQACGADSFRPQLHWHQVEPFLAAGLSGPEDVTEELVDTYAHGHKWGNWARYDRMIAALVQRRIEPHIVLGAGYDFQLPISSVGRTCARAVPDCIGRDRYLAHLYLHARAAVRRYNTRVHVWQLENELNAAGETMLFVRWRSGRSWLDFGYLTAIMDVLSRAVRTEDPTALTSHNFLTQWRVIPGIYDWRKDVKRWHRYLDIIGVDAYPNYLFGLPSRGAALAKPVRRAVEIAEGKPVMVLESGYPVKPRHRGMSEARQAEYACDVLPAAVEAGASGFYYYTLVSPEGFPVQGPWSNRFFQSVEPWWGMVRIDDSKRPAWFEYQKAMENARAACVERAGPPLYEGDVGEEERGD